MSRITGTDAANLIEAYNDVYAPQELTEEQVWEEVEAWVNSLVEEGYDLSEYTWEDMYEEYLNEMGQRATTGQMTAPRNAPQTSAKPAPSQATRPAGGGMGGLRGSGRDRTSYQTSSSPGALRVNPSSAPYQSRFAGARDAAFNRARQIQGSPVVGPRVAAPAARPAAQAPAAAPTRPVAPTSPKPSPTTTTAPATAPAAPARTFNPLMQRTFGYQTGYAPSQVKQDPKKMAVMGSIKSSFDPFDIVKGHLIDEGYADTEEAAAVIMVNMSEEWREGILEKFGLAADPSKPQSPKATKLARKRKRHDDWEGPGGEKMAQKARRVIGTQRRQDTETGVTK